ncbi:MAG: hypothetical protein ACLFUF_05680 [Opitutales bacterium]
MSTTILQSSSSDSPGFSWESPDNQRKTEERTVPLEELPHNFDVEREYEFEIDYAHTRFPVEGDVFVRVADPVNAPIRLGYSDKDGTLEVLGWGVSVPLDQAADLPRQIGRRFLELYSKAVTGVLRDDERQWLRAVSEQIDYHDFAANRKLPRYREATLIRRTPVLLVQFLDDRNVRLDASLTRKLCAIDDGERFGAWFTIDGNGVIADLNHVLRLPSLEEDLRNLPPAPAPVDLPASLKSQLPQPRQQT